MARLEASLAELQRAPSDAGSASTRPPSKSRRLGRGTSAGSSSSEIPVIDLASDEHNQIDPTRRWISGFPRP
eukprot:2379146-Pyramimonas_sp.AAC.1